MKFVKFKTDISVFHFLWKEGHRNIIRINLAVGLQYLLILMSFRAIILTVKTSLTLWPVVESGPRALQSPEWGWLGAAADPCLDTVLTWTVDTDRAHSAISIYLIHIRRRQTEILKHPNLNFSDLVIQLLVPRGPGYCSCTALNISGLSQFSCVAVLL